MMLILYRDIGLGVDVQCNGITFDLYGPENDLQDCSNLVIWLFVPFLFFKANFMTLRDHLHFHGYPTDIGHGSIYGN